MPAPRMVMGGRIGVSGIWEDEDRNGDFGDLNGMHYISTSMLGASRDWR